MEKKRPKYDRTYIEKLKSKGMISEDTYRLCMADGGVVPEITEDSPFFGRTLTNIGNAIGNAYSNLRDQTEGIRTGTQPAIVPASEIGPQVAPMPVEPGPVPVEELATAPQAPVPQESPAQKNINDLNQSFGKVEGAIQKQAADATASAQAESQELGSLQERLQEQQAKDQLREQERLKAVEQKEAELQKVSEEMKVDPTRWEKNFWADASTGRKILAGVGLILGGAGSVKIFDDAVQRDIDAQKANIDKTIGTQKTLLQSMRDRFGDERTAELAAKRVMYDQAELKLKQIGANYKGAEAQGRMQLALAELGMQKAKLQSEWQATAYQQQALKDLTGGNAQDQMAQYLPAELRERYVPGYGLALTKEAAAKANEKVSVMNSSIDGLKELRSMADKGSSLSLEDRAKAQTLATYLKGTLRTELVGPGAVSEGDWKLLDTIIANPTNISQLSGPAKVRLDTLMKMVKRGGENQLRQAGLKPKKQLSFGDRVR